MKRKNKNYGEKNNVQALDALRTSYSAPDLPMCRNNLRSANEFMFKKGRHSSHPRTRTNGAFGNLSKFNKRLKAQANNWQS